MQRPCQPAWTATRNLLRLILHDWSDEDSIAILSSVRHAIGKAKARLLIVECEQASHPGCLGRAAAGGGVDASSYSTLCLGACLASSDRLL